MAKKLLTRRRSRHSGPQRHWLWVTDKTRLSAFEACLASVFVCDMITMRAVIMLLKTYWGDWGEVVHVKSSEVRLKFRGGTGAM